MPTTDGNKYNSRNLAQSLIELGRQSSFDATKLRRTTVYSSASHINLLKRNGLSIKESTLTRDVPRLLDTLVDRHGRKLSNGYKFQIGMTIKRLFPEARVDLRRYNRDRQYNVTRVSSPKFMRNMKAIVDAAARTIGQSYEKITDIGMYDTAVTVMLSCTTSLRVSEIRQLHMSDLDAILSNRPINIKTKARLGPRQITLNDTLTVLAVAIKRQRDVTRRMVKDQYTDAHTSKMTKRFDNDYVVLSSTSFMGRKLRELAAIAVPNEYINVLGFNSFRKLLTTVLVDGGEHILAKIINNHSNLDTTLRYYNVANTQALEDTFNDMERMRREIFSEKLITENDARQRTVAANIPPQKQEPLTPAAAARPSWYDDNVIRMDDEDSDEGRGDEEVGRGMLFGDIIKAAPLTPPPSMMPMSAPSTPMSLGAAETTLSDGEFGRDRHRPPRRLAPIRESYVEPLTPPPTPAVKPTTLSQQQSWKQKERKKNYAQRYRE